MPSNHRRGSARHGNAGAADKGGEERHYSSTPRSFVKSKLLAIAPHSKPTHVVVSVEGYPPITVASKRLKSEQQFRNVCRSRFGIEMNFDGDWSVNVADARRNGGAQ